MMFGGHIFFAKRKLPPPTLPPHLFADSDPDITLAVELATIIRDYRNDLPKEAMDRYGRAMRAYCEALIEAQQAKTTTKRKKVK